MVQETQVMSPGSRKGLPGACGDTVGAEANSNSNVGRRAQGREWEVTYDMNKGERPAILAEDSRGEKKKAQRAIKMACWIKSDPLGSNPWTHWQKERTDPRKLSSSFHSPTAHTPWDYK